MIVANMAIYPPRLDDMLQVVRAPAPQVDRLNVVLNEYSSITSMWPRKSGPMRSRSAAGAMLRLSGGKEE